VGTPRSIPFFVHEKNKNGFKKLPILIDKCNTNIKYGRGNSKNIINYEKFVKLFNEYGKDASNIAELYDANHKAYFNAIDKAQYIQGKKCIVTYSCAGLYLTNIEEYFTEFKESTFIYPLRDVMGYVASEKIRFAKHYFGLYQYAEQKLPNIFIKKFKNYDLKAQIRAWMVALTRAVLLQEKYGVNDRFVAYCNEGLLKNKEGTMRALCSKIGLSFHSSLLEPTIANMPWANMSHQCQKIGIYENSINCYSNFLSEDEIAAIEKETAPIREYLLKNSEIPLDLTKLNKDHLYDYIYQEKYFHDNENIALYSALLNVPRHKINIKLLGVSAVIAYLYAKIIWVLRISGKFFQRFYG
jgi:hypothetical protein